MLLLDVPPLQDEQLRVQDLLLVDVLDKDLEHLRRAVHLVVPLEVRGDGELELEDVARDRLHVRRQLQLRELVDELVDGLAHLGKADELADLLGRHVEEPLPLHHVLLLQLLHHLLGDLLELAQRHHRPPHALVHHLAEVEALERERGPPPPQHDLVQRTEQTPSRLGDVDHVGHQRESVQLQLRDVRLEEHVDLGGRLLDALLDRDRHPVRELVQLHLLLLPHHHVLELPREGEDAQQLDIGHRGLEVVVEHRDRLVADVEVRRHAPQVRALEVAALAVVLDEVGLEEGRRRRVDQVRPSLLHRRVFFHLVGRDVVERGVPQHPHVEVRVPEPLDSLADVLDGPEHDLRVEDVRQVLNHLGLDRELLVEKREVVLQLRVRCDDDACPGGVVLRAASTPHHLHHVERRKLDPPTLLRVVDLRALDDNGVCGEVDAPREGCRRDQHLDVAVGEERLDKLAVRARHPRVVDPEPEREKLLEVARLDSLGHLPANFLRRRILHHEPAKGVVVLGHGADRLGGLGCLLARVHEHQHLVLPGLCDNLIVADLVHELEALERLLLRDPDVLLLQRARPVRVIEVKEALLLVDAQHRRHVLVVGQRRREADEAHQLLRGLDLADGPRDERLEHRAARVVEQVDLVDDHQLHQAREGPGVALAGDDVILLGSHHDHVRLAELLLVELDISGELLDDDPERLQALRKVHHDLRDQRLHGRQIDNLELVKREAAVLPPVQPDLVQHGEQRDVGLTGAGGRADEHVVRVEQRGFVHPGLDAVKRVGAIKGRARPLGELRDLLEHVVVVDVLHRGHEHLLVALVGDALGALRQLAPLVRHQVPLLGESEGLEIKHDARRRARLAVQLCRGAVRHLHVLRRRPLLAEPADLLPETLLHLALALALRLVREGERVQDRAALREFVHLHPDRLLLRLILGLAEEGAVDDGEAVREEQLDEVELLVVQQDHQAVLDLALILRLHDLHHLGGHFHSVVVVVDAALLLHLPLQPVRVQRERVQLVIASALVRHLVVIVLQTDHRAADLLIVNAIILILVLVAQLVSVALLLLLVLIEHHRHAKVLIHGCPLRPLLLQVEVGDAGADLH
mmetsp:Transcript_62196/g.148188  ORF Transcript_62196/g.148188 Transcript_62196/m.148188 type:complete len:1090 (-) Transcript_62196:715-3984(-)